MKVFVYKLILIDRLFKRENWTKEDGEILDRHVAHFAKMEKEGTLLLAGKTEGLDESTYGLCFFKANDLEEADVIMKSDPAVKEGIMTGYLHEYSLAFFNKDFNYKE